MPPTSDPTRPVVIALHSLGAGAREFEALTAALGADAEVVAIDLPGFGGRPLGGAASVGRLADAVVDEIRRRRPSRWVLLGHSMGGKVATAVAARTLSGDAPLFGLAGVVLLAASPPQPEPMDEDQRAHMLGWTAGGAPLTEAMAREFIDGNVGGPLPQHLDRIAVDDLLRAAPEAWTAWLEAGSREDLTFEVGTLDLPALVVAGGDDDALGPDAQRRLNGAVYPRARHEVLRGAGHLLPLERPAEVAGLLRAWWAEDAGLGPSVPRDFAWTLASDRTSARTRGVLARRAVADDPSIAPRVLSPDQLDTLRALADVVLPQPGIAIDLAARVDAQLAGGIGDGWRDPRLPDDAEAYRLGLDAVGGIVDLDPVGRRALIGSIVAGEHTPVGPWTAPQLRAWLDDARADLARQWVAHPATMAALGFDGVANGGDGPRLQGFTELRLGRREDWEPVMGSGR